MDEIVIKKYKLKVPANKAEAAKALEHDEEDFAENEYSVADTAKEEGRDLTRKILKYLKPPGFEQAPAKPGSKPSLDEELDY